jgi:hypothetical protein
VKQPITAANLYPVRARIEYTLSVCMLCVWLGLAACATVDPQPPRELLDESTGETLVVSGRPLVFARQRTDVAANARDYLTAVAVREDNNGKYGTWLVVYRWSTVDRRFGGAVGPRAGLLHIVADDRLLSLRSLPETPASLANDAFKAMQNTGVPPSVYAVGNDDLRAIAAARELMARYDDDVLPLPYRIWKDGRPSLNAWLAIAPRR